MAAAGGSFALSLDFGVCTSGACPDGDYAVQVTATDALGNVSAPFTVTVTVDRYEATPVVTPALPAATRLSQLAVAGTAGEGSTVTVTASGAGEDPAPVSMVAAGGTFSLSLDFDVCTSGACPDGDYAVQVTATDALGNVSAPFTATVTVDRYEAAPVVTPALPAATRLSQLSVAGAAGAGSTLR